MDSLKIDAPGKPLAAAGHCLKALLVASFTVAVVAGNFASRVEAASPADTNPVLATVGAHQITQDEVDARLLQSFSSTRLYDMRKQVIDAMVDEYVVEQAAKKASLTDDQFLRSAVKVKPVTDSEARDYYDKHKQQVDAQTHNKPYDQIKSSLISALQKQRQDHEVESLLAKMRAEQGVKIALQEPRFSVTSVGNASTGGKDATLTIVEFADFQCPYCRSAEKPLSEIRKKYGNKIRLVYMDFPLGMHAHAFDAASAARCAGEQNKFWQYHDALFADQGKLDPANLKATAAKNGLDMEKFNGCFDSKKYETALRKDMDQGSKLGISGTPTFFVNGREVSGSLPVTAWSKLIDEELARAKQPENATTARR
jgi:protein-disulfide isomerase